MGKGNRNSQKRAEEKIVNSEKNLERQKKETNKKRGDRAIAAVLVAFALIVVVAIVASSLTDAGVFLRSQSAMETTNVEVDAAMMSFFFNEYLMNWYNENGAYLSYFSINPSASLQAQPYGKGLETAFYGAFDGTWYEYFLEQVSGEVEMYINYAEGALEAGLELDAEDKESIDELVDNIKASLKESGASFGDWYGRGVKEKDIRACYELVFLASNFQEYKLEKLEEAIEADDSAIYDYVEDNKNLFYTADVLSFSITESSDKFGTDAAYDAAVAMAKAEAEKIAAAKTPAEFANLVDVYKASLSTSTETSTDAEADVEEKIEDLKSTVNYNVPENDEDETETETADELNNWLFVEEAPANSTLVVEKESQKTEAIKTESDSEKESGDEGESESETMPQQIKIIDTYTVTVYFVYEPVHLDKSLTKDAAFLITDDKAILESFIEAFKKGEQSRDAFVELAEKTASDMHEDHDHDAEDFEEPTFIYDSVEKMVDNYFNETYQPINDWLDSGALVDGSVSDIIEVEIKDDGTYYTVIFFEKYNDEAWYASAQSYVLNDQFEAWEKAQQESEPIVVNEKAIMNIPTIILTSGTTGHEGHDH